MAVNDRVRYSDHFLRGIAGDSPYRLQRGTITGTGMDSVHVQWDGNPYTVFVLKINITEA